MASIRVMLVEDHTMVREGFRSILERRPDIVVVGEAADGREAVDMAHRLSPDVILMDYHMPLMDGIAATRLIVGRNPAAKVLMLTMEASDHLILEAVRAGAWGYVLKGARARDLVDAVLAVHSGRIGFDAEVSGRVFQEFRRIASSQTSNAPLLSEREHEILEMMAAGNTNQRIAEALCASEQTIKNNLSRIYSRLQVRNRAEATAAFLAMKEGRPRPEPSMPADRRRLAPRKVGQAPAATPTKIAGSS